MSPHSSKAILFFAFPPTFSETVSSSLSSQASYVNCVPVPRFAEVFHLHHLLHYLRWLHLSSFIKFHSNCYCLLPFGTQLWHRESEVITAFFSFRFLVEQHQLMMFNPIKPSLCYNRWQKTWSLFFGVQAVKYLLESLIWIKVEWPDSIAKVVEVLKSCQLVA